MRVLIALLLLAVGPARADRVLLLETHPEGCKQLEDVAIRTGGKWQGLFFSNAWIRNNALEKLEDTVSDNGGNRTVIKDKRVFLMDNHNRGIKHIEIDAGVWHCEKATQQ